MNYTVNMDRKISINIYVAQINDSSNKTTENKERAKGC
jgi:hypothetical protein